MLQRGLQLAIAFLLMSATSGLALASPPLAAADGEETVTTRLQPGWNLAGWTGEEAEVSAIFEAIPQLEAVFRWDAFARKYSWAFRDESGPTGTLTTLTPGMGLSLYVGGVEAVEWTRPLIPQTGAVTLRPGWNLVTWAGDDGAAAEDAFEPLGDIVLESQGVDGAAVDTLTRGSAFWLQASALKEWWQLDSPPVVIFKRGLAAYEKAGLQRDVDSVVGYFGRELGVGVSGLRIRFGHDRVECGGYLAKTVYLNDICFRSLAHEYVHALQEELTRRNEREDDEPAWLTEGTAEYWSEQYKAWRRNGSYEDGLHNSVIPRARRATAPLSRLWNYNALLAQTNGYALAHLAVDWLVNHAGEEALLTHYAQPGQSAWTSRFKSAFGLSPGEFYEEFEAYRAKVAPPIYRISGEIRDYSGRLLNGVNIAIYDPDGESLVVGNRIHWPGEFNIAVPEGSYLLSFSAGECHIGWYGRHGRVVASPEQAVPVESSVRATNLEVRMRSLCPRIEGTIRDIDQSALGGIRVEAFSEASGRRVATGESGDTGKFSLTVPDGSYLLSLWQDGRRIGWYAGWDLTASRSDATPVVVDSDNIQQVFRTASLLVVLVVRVEFKGIVVYPDGSPVEGIQVIAASPEGSVALARTDADGAFSFRVREGAYTLWMQNERCQFVWYRRNDDATSARDEATSIVTAVDSTTGIVIRLREPPAAGDCPR